MKIILEFKHPCELVDLFEKLVQSYPYTPKTACDNVREQLVEECSDETSIYKARDCYA